MSQGNQENAAGFSNEIVQQFLSTQQINAENRKLELEHETHRLELDREKMRLNAELAHKSMDYQREYLAAQVPEDRKKIIVYAAAAGIGLFAILGFVMWCVYMGKEDIALKVFLAMAAILTHYITFRFGRQAGLSEADKKTHALPVEDADVVE